MQDEIRDIKVEDVLVAFGQLKNLADISGLSDKLITTAESLESELFKDGADWFGLIAEVEGQIAGSCFYSIANNNREFHSTPAIYIDVLYVDEKYRKLGIARSLITEVITIAKSKKIKRIELWCLKTNDAAQATYASLGATKLATIDVIRFDVEKFI